MKTDFSRWASAPPSWAAGHELGPVLSTRVRIARNLAGLPFPHNASAASQRAALDRAFEAAPQLMGPEKGQSLVLPELSGLERGFLMERQLISHEHARSAGERGLIIAAGEALSIMVNEEDHVRAAAFRAGAGLDDAWTALSAVDDQLCARLPIAFESEFGFATACPTNMGTGLRASCQVHLAAAVITNRIGPILEGLSRAGLTARGAYGEGTSAAGDLFQISNARTMGRTEAQILRDVEKAVRHVAAIEAKEASALLSGESKRAVEDRIFRALGTLRHARLLEHGEAMSLLSFVRFGLRCGMDLGVSPDVVNDLVYLTQPSHVLLRNSAQGENVPEAALRAELVRERLAGRKGG